MDPAGERLVRVGGIRGKGRASGVEISGKGAQIFEFADRLVKRFEALEAPPHNARWVNAGNETAKAIAVRPRNPAPDH